MVSVTKVFSYIALGIAIICLGPYIYHHVEKRENESKWSLWGFILALVISIILTLSDKGKDLTIEDLICLLMILLAFILAFKSEEFKTRLMAIAIALLGAIQLIIGASSLDTKL